jgi:hypothetical protein
MRKAWFCIVALTISGCGAAVRPHSVPAKKKMPEVLANAPSDAQVRAELAKMRMAEAESRGAIREAAEFDKQRELECARAGTSEAACPYQLLNPSPDADVTCGAGTCFQDIYGMRVLVEPVLAGHRCLGRATWREVAFARFRCT